MYHLYKKTHNKTGLSYLGQTTQDPYKYSGSGLYWKYHINKHGYDVTTVVLGSYADMALLSGAGLFYSKLWNVAESDDWANLKEEAGGLEKPTELTKQKMTGPRGSRVFSTEHRNNLSKAMKGKKASAETKAKMSYNKTGSSNPRYGKSFNHTEETKRLLSIQGKGRKNPNARNNALSLCEKNKGAHWYTDGVENVLSHKCPAGWGLGRTKSWTRNSKNHD